MRETKMGQRDKGGKRQRLRETKMEISGRSKNGKTERRLTEIQILGRETGEVRERGEQEINIKDLSNRQSKETERDRDRETVRERRLERTGKT